MRGTPWPAPTLRELPITPDLGSGAMGTDWLPPSLTRPTPTSSRRGTAVKPVLGPLAMLERAPGRYSITGELDLATAPQLDHLEDVHGPLLLDLHGVTFMDSSGIAALVRSVEALPPSGLHAADRSVLPSGRAGAADCRPVRDLHPGGRSQGQRRRPWRAGHPARGSRRGRRGSRVGRVASARALRKPHKPNV